MDLFTNWLFWALLTPAIFAIVNILDDNLLSKVYRSAYFATIISGLFGFLPVLLFPFVEFSSPSVFVTFLGILSGSLTVLYYLFYFKGLESEYPSVVIAIFALAPALIPFLSYLFLGEVLTISQYLGALVILGSSFIIADIKLKKIKPSRAFVLVSIGAVIFAIIAVMSKYVYDQVEFWTGYLLFAMGMGIGALILSVALPEGRRFYPEMKKKFKKWILIFALVELVNIAAEFANNKAVSMGQISLVKIIEGTQPMFVLLLAILFFPIFPKYLREATAGNRTRKLICMAFILLGLYLIYR